MPGNGHTLNEIGQKHLEAFLQENCKPECLNDDLRKRMEIEAEGNASAMMGRIHAALTGKEAKGNWRTYCEFYLEHFNNYSW